MEDKENKSIVKSNILEHLYTKYGNFWIEQYIGDTCDFSDWSKWKKYSTYKNNGNEKLLRSIFPEEIVLDIEDENIEDIKTKLIEKKINFKLWKSGGRGYHFHIFFSELKNYDESIRPNIKSIIIKELSFDRGDQKKKDNKNLIGVEFYKHRKGGIKELIFQTEDDFYLDNKLPQTLLDFIKTLPEKYDNYKTGDFKAQIIFKDRKPCQAISDLIKSGTAAGERNKYANFIVQQLRDYCGYSIEDCFKVLKKYNNNCKPSKDESIIKSDLKEQYNRKYNINCNTLCDYCKWKRKEDCTKHKQFNGIEYYRDIVVDKTKKSKNESNTIDLSNISDNKMPTTIFRQIAIDFYEKQPFFYDENKLWWMWNKEECFWKIVDETTLLVEFDKYFFKDTENATLRNCLLEAMKKLGRIKKPEEVKPTWIQFKDVIYDINTNEKFKATSKYFATNPLPWRVGESEDTPTIDKLFREWVGKEDIQKLYEIIAFVPVPKYFIHSFWFFYSPPGYGKSTMANLIVKFIGDNNYTTSSIDRINKNIRFETVNWYKKLLIVMGEASHIDQLKNSSLLNQATGEDPIAGEFKGGKQFNFTNYAKFIYPTNKILKISIDDGFGRRARTLDFITRFEKERDVLNEIPEYEMENLAKKSIRIAGELWKKRQFTNDVSISKRMAEHQERSKTNIEKFIDKHCITDDFEAFMPFSEFYAEIKKIDNSVGSKIEVSKELKRLQWEIKNKNYKNKQKSITISEDGWIQEKSILGLKLKKIGGSE